MAMPISDGAAGVRAVVDRDSAQPPGLIACLLTLWNRCSLRRRQASARDVQRSTDVVRLLPRRRHALPTLIWLLDMSTANLAGAMGVPSLTGLTRPVVIRILPACYGLHRCWQSRQRRPARQRPLQSCHLPTGQWHRNRSASRRLAVRPISRTAPPFSRSSVQLITACRPQTAGAHTTNRSTIDPGGATQIASAPSSAMRSRTAQSPQPGATPAHACAQWISSTGNTSGPLPGAICASLPTLAFVTVVLRAVS